MSNQNTLFVFFNDHAQLGTYVTKVLHWRESLSLASLHEIPDKCLKGASEYASTTSRVIISNLSLSH